MCPDFSDQLWAGYSSCNHTHAAIVLMDELATVHIVLG